MLTPHSALHRLKDGPGILFIQQLIKIILSSSYDHIQVPSNHTVFALCLFRIGEILGRFASAFASYPKYLSFTLRCFQLLIQLVQCQRLVCCYCFLCRLVACLYLSLPSCLRDVSHIFFPTFLAFITSYTLSFHHHVSSSHGGLRPVVRPSTSCPTLNIVVLV